MEQQSGNRRDVTYCYEKLAVGPPAGAAKPTRETFHGFRVSQWGVKSWFEKFIAGMALGAQRGLSPTKMSCLFEVSGCPRATCKAVAKLDASCPVSRLSMTFRPGSNSTLRVAVGPRWNVAELENSGHDWLF